MNQSRWAPKPAAEGKKSTSTLPPSSLSAAAPSFSPPTPAPPPPDISTFDAFAPTGAEQDDLFDDVVPVDDSMRVRSDDDLFSDDFTPIQEAVVEQPVPRGPRGRADVNNRGRVRGDRRATGGLRKPKLTESELAEKMARISIKNASLTAAHARAEADAASFAEREEESKLQAAQRQKVERKDRQQMMGEREKNRMRKLKALGGREWDAEKNEDDFDKGGRYDKKGGFGGEKEEYTDGREYLYREPTGSGQRGARGGARGGKAQEQPAPKHDDFPALPTTNKVASGEDGKSWADQVESSNPT